MWEKEKLLVQAISPFPTMYSKACFPGVSNDVIVWECVNSLPHGKILDGSKSSAFADNKINVTEKLKFVLGRVENIVKHEGQDGPGSLT